MESMCIFFKDFQKERTFFPFSRYFNLKTALVLVRLGSKLMVKMKVEVIQ